MPTHTGRIRVIATPMGKRLSLTKPNPTPPPEENVEWSTFDPPAWLWEIVVGNAGKTCSVSVDDAGTPTVAVVS